MLRAALSLSVLTALCSLLTACGGRAVQIPPAPVVEERLFAPAPGKPGLPALRAELPLDAPANSRLLLVRDDILRQHINAMHHWAAQVPQRSNGLE